jgi:hypothetical protein
VNHNSIYFSTTHGDMKLSEHGESDDGDVGGVVGKRLSW